MATTRDLGRVNAASVLAAVLAEGPLARAEIAERVGLTRATVTRVTNRLLEVHLLKEGPPRRGSSLGRPLVPLALDGEDRVVIAVHLGTHEARVGVVDLQGRVLSEERNPHPSRDPGTLVGAVARHVDEVRARVVGQRRVLGVGASTAGWVEPESGRVVHFEPLGWRDVPLADQLRAATGLPVQVDQTVRGLALAERMFGAVRGHRDFLELWVGNVVGAAVVHAGTVRRGPRGASGVVTHFPVRGGSPDPCTCGRVGCLVRSVTDDALVAEARRRCLLTATAGIRDLLEAARSGDEEVRALVVERAALTGEAAAAMADLVNPSTVVVAGLITTAPGYLEAFRRAFTASGELGELVEVRDSAFGDLAPTIASASVMLDAYFRDPLRFEELSI